MVALKDACLVELMVPLMVGTMVAWMAFYSVAYSADLMVALKDAC